MKKILLLLGILILINCCSAGSDWNYACGNRDMNIGNTLTCDDYAITLKDYSANDDGLVNNILIEIANGEQKQTEIISIGNSYKFGDDRYSISYVNYKKNKINVAVYKYTSPIFKFSTETEESNSNRYDYESTITLTCYDADACNIKVTCDDNVRENFDNFKMSHLRAKKSKEVDIKYSYNDNSKLILNVEYEDNEGNEYTQSYDVLCNLVVTEHEESGIATTNRDRVIQRYSNEYYAKKVFIKAIDTALSKISFTESEKLQLEQIKNSLEQSL